jgi:hypothetical protein
VALGAAADDLVPVEHEAHRLLGVIAEQAEEQLDAGDEVLPE